MDVVRLLQNKTRCLQRFVEESSRFLAQAEAGQPEGMPLLEAFLEAREGILRAIDLFDRKIDEAVLLTSPEARTEALKQAVAAEVQEQVQWLGRSAKIDERISQVLILESTRLKQAAASNDKGRKTLGKFKSQTNESGSSSGQVLDHEL